MDFERTTQGGTGGTAGQSAGETGGSTPDTSRDVDAPAFTAAGSPAGSSTDDGTRAGSFDRKFVGDDRLGGDGVRERVSEGIEHGRERLQDTVDTNRERIQGAIDSGKGRVASQLERLGVTLEQRARDMEQAGGVQRRAGQVGLRASSALDTGAEYIRSHEPQEMRDDLEDAIRQRPLLSVGVAVGAGFLLARLMRD
ncbi:MAG TPA: hypothetical protein VMN60_07225 [Longimicrobiales bacterium]|nr:hypothetical protein [Longimicrobiales bacterium]